MQIIKELSAWQTLRQTLPGQLGFVPTMGALHAGHVALLKQARAECDTVVLSIFVNPTQFNRTDDFECYPNTQAADCLLAEQCGVDVVLILSVDEIYAQQHQISLQASGDIVSGCEAMHRPGHFDGMLTVVLKWLLLVTPAKAYFGKKDDEQLQAVRCLVKTFFLPIEIVAVETKRSADGLPLSSRLQRLSTEERALAAACTQRFRACEGSLDCVIADLQALGARVEYCQRMQQTVYIAFYIGNVRLIDHINWRL